MKMGMISRQTLFISKFCRKTKYTIKIYKSCGAHHISQKEANNNEHPHTRENHTACSLFFLILFKKKKQAKLL